MSHETRHSGHTLRAVLITILVILAVLAAAAVRYPSLRYALGDIFHSTDSAESGTDSEHDVTLDTKTYADFATPLLGQAKRSALLTVEERSVTVIVNSTQEGFFDWDVLKKSEAVRYYGTAQYTIDLSGFSESDIDIDHDAKTVTITIPDAQLHSVTVDPSKTEVLSQSNGLLAWGELKLTTEEQQKLESSAIRAMKEELDEENAIADARRFAALTAWETFWPVVSSISESNDDSYSLIINQSADTVSSTAPAAEAG